MNEIKHIKFFKKALAYRSKYTKLKKLDLVEGLEELIGLELKIGKSKTRKGFTFSLNKILDTEKDEIESVVGQFGNISVKIDKLSIESRQRSLEKGIARSITQGIISKFRSANFNDADRNFVRAIYSHKEQILYHDHLDNSVYHRESIKHGNTLGLDIHIKGKTFHICQTEHKGIHYTIIDCLTQLGFEEFSDISYNILMALGFTTGVFIQNEVSYITYKELEMKHPFGYCYSTLRNSIVFNYPPLENSIHSHIDDYEIAEKYLYNDIRKRLDMRSFSNLCFLCEDQRIQAIMILIFESMSNSLVIMPCGLSVVFEVLANYFESKFEAAFSVFNHEVATQIQGKLKGTLVEWEECIELREGLDKYKNSINNINRISNKARLKKPFEVLGIILNDDDLKILDQRNNFLHGRKTLVDVNVYFMSLSMLRLVSSVLLKMSGYTGLVFDHSEKQKFYTLSKNHQAFYRTL